MDHGHGDNILDHLGVHSRLRLGKVGDIVAGDPVSVLILVGSRRVLCRLWVLLDGEMVMPDDVELDF